MKSIRGMNKYINILRNNLFAQRDRWVLWLPVPLGLGIAFYFSLKSEPPVMAGAAVLGLMGLVAAAFHKNKTFMLVLLPLVLLVVGFTAAQFRTVAVDAPVLKRKTYYPITLTGRIAEVTPLPKTFRIVLEDFTVEWGKTWVQELPRRVRIKLKGTDPTEPIAGDIVSIKAVLLPLSPPVYPGAFDFQRYAFFDKLGATGYAVSDLEVVQHVETGFIFARLRKYIRDRIEANISDKEHAAVITAFMIGESKAIPETVWTVARESGIAHLIAISGSHFVLIAGFPFFFVRALLAAIPFVALRWPIKKIAAGAGIAASVFYMMLIGAPIPAQRAVLSVCVVMGAIIIDRDPFTLRLAAFASLVILLLEPESLLGASFQLSFAAIVALIAFYEMTRRWWLENWRDENIAKRWVFYLLGCCLSSIVASAATAPFALYHFARVPLLAGLAANMIAVPVSTFITFPSGLFACLMMPFGLEKYPLWVTEQSLELTMRVARAVIDWPLSSYTGGAAPGWFLLPVTLGGLWLCLWKGRMRFFGILPIVVACACLPFTQRPDVIAADTGLLFAVRDDSGALWFSNSQIDKFAREEWMERDGTLKPLYWDSEGEFAGGKMFCEESHCLYHHKRQKVTFISDATKQALEACQGSKLVFSQVDMNRNDCGRDTLLRDVKNLKYFGAHSVFIGENGLIIETVRETRGIRPWTDGAPVNPVYQEHYRNY
jgi:competence protein ComEC